MPQNFFLVAVMLLFAVLFSRIPEGNAAGGTDQEGSAAQAQATLASLFGPKAVMPLPPSVSGSIALPGFDSKDLRIDEGGIPEKTAVRKE